MHMTYEKRIAILTAGLVIALTTISLILTYNALYDVAYDNGLTDILFLDITLAHLWPLTIDGALIVFSLAVVNSSLSNDNPWLRWVMVGVFTFLTIVFNVVDGGTDKLPAVIGATLPFIVRIVPPIALVLSFETIMSMLRKSVKRDTLTKSIEQLSEDQNKMSGKIVTLKRQKDTLLSQIDNLKSEKKTVTMTPRQKRMSELPALIDSGLTVKDLAVKFGVQERQIYRDIEELEGGKDDNS